MRYADDFLVFTKTREAARSVYESIGRYLTRKLELVVNEQKSRVWSTNGVEFLGFVFPGYGGQSRVARKNLDKFQARVRELRRYFQGWEGCFRLVPIKRFFGELDKWVRRRIRMCFWVNWKTGRTRAANLLKLGVAEHEAFTHGTSSKGPWVLSSSQAVHQARSTALLEEWGLPSLLGIWKTLTAKSRTAECGPAR